VASKQAFLASYAQARMWFLHQLEPELTAYHLPVLLQLTGELDRSALVQALGSLIERHPTLRTSFRLHGSEVIQIIHPQHPFPLEVEVLGGCSPDALIHKWLDYESSTPFDLSSGLLLRARLLVVDDQRHLLLLNHHHIASDGWSCSVLAHDLVELYNAHHSGRSPELQPLAVHYQDYAAWQRQRLSGLRLQELKQYWIPQLTHIQSLELPIDYPRPATPSYTGDSIAFSIEPFLLVPFEHLCRAEGATLQMGLLALLSLLLHRYSRQDDFAIGVPIWGRIHPDLEPLIGFFINTLPIRIHVPPDITFRQLLAQVADTSLSAYNHQELPFEQMVESLHLERDTSRNPLVQVMLQLIELPEASLHNLKGLDVQTLEFSSNASRFDLEFFFRRHTSGGINATLVYATDLFSADRIQRLVSHLRSLLISALERPDASVASLTILPEAERKLIESWQHGPAMDVADLCAHQLFERQVECTPEAIALIFEDQELTYSDLNTRANQLAHHLIDLGVGPELIVGVCLERSLELIIAVLAIFKAGGAYLPFDPAWPRTRIEQLVTAAAPCLLVSTSELTKFFDSSCRLLCLEHLDFAQLPVVNLPKPGFGIDSLAYVLFTSGSTGAPKGVQVTHRTLANLMAWSRDEPRLGRPAKTLQFAASVFDVSLQEIFSALSIGGSVYLVDEDMRKDFGLLCELVVNLEIERIFMPYVALELFAKTLLESSAIPTLKLRDIISAGEKLVLTRSIRDLVTAMPDCRLHNHYGPTESHVVSSHQLSTNYGEWPKESSIGVPINNSVLIVLDSFGQPCPIGVPGELHIGGAGLARGYLNNPLLSAETFIPDPFSDDPTARLYKSGDLASWNPNGTLAFHGRIDQQINLRGFRIEPGEIEANLLAHPAVAQAVVVLRNDDPANPRLIAYWVPESPNPLAKPGVADPASAALLRSFLVERLPDYMVPSAFLPLETLPCTINGKLDRKALPAPSFVGDLDQRVEPSTDQERQLHAIWVEVLGHSDFGITDNFFTIGGHSLLTMRVGQLVRERFSLDVPIYIFFSHPTIQQLGSELNGMILASSADRESPVDSEWMAGTFALPPPIHRFLFQQRLLLERWPGERAHGHQFVRMLGCSSSPHSLFWCFQGAHEHQALAQGLSPDVRLYGMRSLHGTDDAETIYRSITLLAIVAGLYAREIYDLAPVKQPLIVGGNCQAAWVAIAIARELVGCGREVQMLILMELRLQEIQQGLLDWNRPVVLIWGADSNLNPFSPAHRPPSRRLRMLQKLAPAKYRSMIHSLLMGAFKGGFQISIVPGVHGAFFRSVNVGGLASVVKQHVVAGSSLGLPS